MIGNTYRYFILQNRLIHVIELYSIIGPGMTIWLGRLTVRECNKTVIGVNSDICNLDLFNKASSKINKGLCWIGAACLSHIHVRSVHHNPEPNA